MAENQSNFTNEQLIELFDAFLSGNNDKIKLATQYLRGYIKKLESLTPLVNILVQSQNAGHRQLAAVLLKKNIASLYLEMQEGDRTQLKNILLERYFLETNSNTRKSIGVAIGEIAKVALPSGQWNELLVVISNKTGATETEQNRENGLKLLSLVIELTGDNLELHYVELHTFLKTTLQDNNFNIKIEAYKCILYMLLTVSKEEHIALYQDLVEPVLGLLLQLIKEQQDEDSIYIGFDAIMNLSESSSNLLDSFLPNLVQYVLSENFLLGKQISVGVKQCGLDFLGVIAEYRKSILTKNTPVLEKFIETLFILITQRNPSQFEGEESLSDVVLFLIEDISIYLPKKKIYKYLAQNIQILFSSNNDSHKLVGFYVLAKMSEGCAEHLRKDLANPVMNTYVAGGLSSQNVKLRSACVSALIYFSQNLMPDILVFHKVIIPALLNNFNALDSDLIQKAVFCIDLFIQNLEQEVIQYLPIIIPQLLNVLESPSTNFGLKRLAISALGACISSSEDQILPYAEDLYKRFFGLLNNNDANVIYLKAQAMTEMGKLISALRGRRDLIQSLFVPCVEIVYQNLKETDDWELREGAFTFFYHLALVSGEEFSPLLSQLKLIEIALERIAATEGIYKAKQQQQQDFSLGSESEDEIAPGDNVGCKTSFLDEKASAIHALGEFAAACPSTFAPYLEQVISALDQTHQYFYDNVRSQVVVCYFNLVKSLLKLSNNGTIPKFKKGLPCTQRIEPKIEEFIKIEVLNKYMHLIKEDEATEVVCSTLECFKDLIETCGPSSVDTSLDQIAELIIIILKGETFCQASASDEEDEESNYEILEALSDLITALSTVLQDGFTPTFQQIYPDLVKYAGLKREIDEIIIAQGIFAEVFLNSSSSVLFCGKNVLELGLATRDINDEEITRNVCYMIGNLAKSGRDSIYPFYPTILQYLKFILENSILPEAKDNALVAACKVAQAGPQLVPVQDLLPVVFQLSPLKGDIEENQAIAEFIIFLLNTNAEALKPNLDRAFALLIDSIINSEKYKNEEEFYAQLIEFVKKAATDNLLEKLNEVEKNVFIKAIN